MNRVSTFLLVGMFGVSAAVSCSSSALNGPTGTGGAGLATGGSAAATGGNGTGGAGGVGGSCQYQHYFAPACGAEASPRCTGVGGSCYSLACGCNGKIIVGCGPEFPEPYAYSIPLKLDGGDMAGLACDPNAGDAGPGGDAGKSVDGGSACASSDVATACSVNHAECGATWSDVLANPVCQGQLPGQVSQEKRADCGAYHIRLISHVDSAEWYYYDAATGAVVAIYSDPGTAAGTTCSAGPAAGVPVACVPAAVPTGSWTQVCGVDGGVVTVLPKG